MVARQPFVLLDHAFRGLRVLGSKGSNSGAMPEEHLTRFLSVVGFEYGAQIAHERPPVGRAHQFVMERVLTQRPVVVEMVVYDCEREVVKDDPRELGSLLEADSLDQGGPEVDFVIGELIADRDAASEGEAVDRKAELQPRDRDEEEAQRRLLK